MRKKITAYMLLCIYLAAIIYLCFMKPDDLPEVPMTFFGLPLDKVVHFCMFAPFPILSFTAFYPKEATTWRQFMLLAVLVAFGAGMAYGTEQLQGMTDYRSYEMADFHADLTGLACGTAAVIAFILFRKK